MTEVFLDTSYAIALAVDDDSHHSRAVAVAEKLQRDAFRIVTTHAILIEIGNALARLRYRAAGVTLLSAIRNDPHIEVVPITDELYAAAFELFGNRVDKEWGLTDCVSFSVMQQRGIAEALTCDNHFRQAGFRAILREP